jgi:hypothetical protein
MKKYLPYLIILLIGGVLGRYLAPSKVITRTEVKTVEVIKWKESKDKKEDRDKVTIITEEIKPDGTKIVRTEIRDKSQVDTITNKDGSSTKDSESKSEKIVEYSKGTLLTLYGGTDLRNPQNGFVYGLGVNASILGPIWLGASIHTNSYLHLGLGINF